MFVEAPSHNYLANVKDTLLHESAYKCQQMALAAPKLKRKPHTKLTTNTQKNFNGSDTRLVAQLKEWQGWNTTVAGSNPCRTMKFSSAFDLCIYSLTIHYYFKSIMPLIIEYDMVPIKHVSCLSVYDVNIFSFFLYTILVEGAIPCPNNMGNKTINHSHTINNYVQKLNCYRKWGR